MTLKRRITVLLLASLVIAAVAAVYYMPQWQAQTPSFSKGAARRGGAPATDPVPVLASAARAADVPVHLDGVGTARALNTVTVRPQVDGKIVSISFTEGQEVPKGFVLAKIDPVTYQAQYDQAVATKGKDEAQLANARLDLERYTRLAATNAINKQQLDTQRALVNQLEAQVKADQAAIDNARAILSYTDIVAPIAGRTGSRMVDEGNLVRASDAGIVVSVFIDAETAQVEAAKRIGAAVCEVHTGPYAHAFHSKGRDAESPAVVSELEKIRKAGELIRSLGMRFNAGHALNYFNVEPVARLPGVRELHIGHAIVARAVFVGMREAVREMKALMSQAAR